MVLSFNRVVCSLEPRQRRLLVELRISCLYTHCASWCTKLLVSFAFALHPESTVDTPVTLTLSVRCSHFHSHRGRIEKFVCSVSKRATGLLEPKKSQSCCSLSNTVNQEQIALALVPGWASEHTDRPVGRILTAYTITHIPWTVTVILTHVQWSFLHARAGFLARPMYLHPQLKSLHLLVLSFSG